jgi:hypothetical protein
MSGGEGQRRARMADGARKGPARARKVPGDGEEAAHRRQTEAAGVRVKVMETPYRTIMTDETHTS